MRSPLRLLFALTAALLIAACAGTAEGPGAKPGFATEVVDGRLWVFDTGSEAYAKYKKSGMEPGKFATAIGAGPDGMTVKAPDIETLNAYLGK
jgi:hypothetical protein